jgi:sialidase-1
MSSLRQLLFTCFAGGAAILPAAAQIDPGPYTQKRVMASSGPDSPRNDCATIAERADGTLYGVWHKYRPNPAAGSDFGRADIAAKISPDGGLSWTDERRIIPVADGDLNVQAPAIIRLPNGEMLIAAMRAHAPDSSSMSVFRSRDDGATWQEEGDIWSRHQGQWLQGGTPSLVRLRDGRLVLPFHGGDGHQGKQHNVAGCFVSDDDGHTWRQTPAVIDLPMRGAMEASVTELGDGRLLMSLRSQLGTVMLCESRDRAESWSLPWSSGLTAPESATCLRRIPGSDLLLLIWNGIEFYEPAHHHFGPRTPLSLAVSADDGRTWNRLGDIEDAPDAEFTNVNCMFTRQGDALITYWKTSPAFNRKPTGQSAAAIAVVSADYWRQVRLAFRR